MLLLTVLPGLAEQSTIEVPAALPAANTAPAGMVETPASTAPLTGSASAGLQEITVDAERFLFHDDGQAEFFGNVEINSPQVNIRADAVRYDDRMRKIFARGNVTITVKDQNSFAGEALEYELARPHAWQFHQVITEYPPEQLGYPFIAPLYVQGDLVEGDDSGNAFINGGHFTTCDRKEPHYEFLSRRISIYPGDKIVARDTDIIVLGKRLLRLPYLVFFLREKQYPLTPEFGQNSEDGYFARLFYPYQLSAEQNGVLRLDLTEKRGQGLGLRHRYNIDSASGELFAYMRNRDNEFSVQLQHQQQLPAGIDAQVSLDLKQNSLFTLQKTTSTNINVNLQQGDEYLNFTRYLNESNFRSDNISALFHYSFPLANGMVSGNSRYSSNGISGVGPSAAADQELWHNLLWTRPFPAGDVQLLVNQRNDLDGNNYLLDSQRSGTQQLPELSFLTNGEKLHLRLLSPLQSTITLGWGIFDEVSGTTHHRLGRSRLEVAAQAPQLRLANSLIEMDGKYFQTVYGDSDTTAQYCIEGNMRVNSHFGDLRNEIYYRRIDVRGYTPFYFDTRYPAHNIDNNLIFEHGSQQDTAHYYTARVSAGRDLLNHNWRDVTLVARIPLGSELLSTQQLGYDPNSKKWRDWTAGYSWVPNERLVLNLGTRYSLEEQQFSRLASELDWRINQQWRVQHRASLNPVSGSFNYHELLLTRDLHCWDATIYLSDAQQTFGFFLRLKAFDMPIPSFGIGRGGEILNSSLGNNNW